MSHDATGSPVPCAAWREGWAELAAGLQDEGVHSDDGAACSIRHSSGVAHSWGAGPSMKACLCSLSGLCCKRGQWFPTGQAEEDLRISPSSVRPEHDALGSHRRRHDHRQRGKPGRERTGSCAPARNRLPVQPMGSQI